MSEEERARAAFNDILNDDGEDDEDEADDLVLKEEAKVDADDLLDQLTGNFDDDDEKTAEETKEEESMNQTPTEESPSKDKLA